MHSCASFLLIDYHRCFKMNPPDFRTAARFGFANRGRAGSWSLRLVIFLLTLRVTVLAETIYVLNFSFESPATDFASPFLNSWQKTPQPPWYADTNFAWSQLVGQFLNTSNGAPDHIDNV